MNQYERINSSFKDRSMAGLLYAFVSGDKSKLFPSVKKKFKTLAVSHLFTPSGVHLASLYFLITPFLKLIRHKLFILLPILSLFYFFTPFHSIKRIFLMKTVKVWKSEYSIFNIFLFSFSLDFLVGTYHLSPLSFSYSFLFLGIILSFVDSPKIFLPLALFGGQIIAQFLSPYPLTTTGFFWNFSLTALFSLFYPFFFLIYWLPEVPFAEGLVSLFYQTVKLSSSIALSLGSFMPTLNLVILSLYFSIGGRKALIIALLLLFSSQPLMNIELRNLKKFSHKRQPYELIEKTRRGFTTWHTDKVCRHRHNLSSMNIKCNYD